MTKNSLSASRVLNIVLSVIVVIGALATYRLANFDGVSFDELGEKYINKHDVKFSDLPQEMQKRYIDKDAIIEQSKRENLLEDGYTDDLGNLVAEENLTVSDYKRLMTKLQKTLLFLQHDNLLMVNEKNELAKKLDEQQKEREEEKSQWLSSNTARLNEAEQQHYKNISDMTIKINELQKESVVMAQKSNSEVNILKNEIEALKNEAQKELANRQIAIKEAREEEPEQDCSISRKNNSFGCTNCAFERTDKKQ